MIDSLIYISLIGYIICNTLSSCTTEKSNKQAVGEIQYPKPFPDSTAIRFLPNVVSKDGLDFNAAFSPDGKSFYFSRSKNRQWDIYVTNFDGKNWGSPVPAPFSDSKYSEADPAFSPDGKLYFISNRTQKNGARSDFDIWYINPLVNGQWSDPQNLAAVNSDSSEYYISFSRTGNLYFGSSRQGGFGSEDIYRSKLINGKYTKPENLGSAVNSIESEHDPCISKQEDFIVFKSDNRTDGYGEADLYCSKLDANKKWLKAVNLGDKFNTSTYEYCPYLSPDSNYFFFSSESDVKWISAKFLRRTIDKLFEKYPQVTPK